MVIFALAYRVACGENLDKIVIGLGIWLGGVSIKLDNYDNPYANVLDDSFASLGLKKIS